MLLVINFAFVAQIGTNIVQYIAQSITIHNSKRAELAQISIFLKFSEI